MNTVKQDRKADPTGVRFHGRWISGLRASRWQCERIFKPIDLKKKDTVSIIRYGEVFNTDNWQTQAIMLIAITVEDDLEVVLKPSRMMDIANSLAAAGVPHIVKMLSEGPQRPIWNLSDAFEKLLQSDTGTEEPSIEARIAETLL